MTTHKGWKLWKLLLIWSKRFCWFRKSFYVSWKVLKMLREGESRLSRECVAWIYQTQNDGERAERAVVGVDFIFVSSLRLAFLQATRSVASIRKLPVVVVPASLRIESSRRLGTRLPQITRISHRYPFPLPRLLTRPPDELPQLSRSSGFFRKDNPPSRFTTAQVLSPGDIFWFHFHPHPRGPLDSFIPGALLFPN